MLEVVPDRNGGQTLGFWKTVLMTRLPGSAPRYALRGSCHVPGSILRVVIQRPAHARCRLEAATRLEGGAGSPRLRELKTASGMRLLRLGLICNR